MEQACLPETVPACSDSRGSPWGLGRQVPACRNEKPVPGECESQRDRVRAQARAPPRRRGRGSRCSHSEAW